MRLGDGRKNRVFPEKVMIDLSIASGTFEMCLRITRLSAKLFDIYMAFLSAIGFLQKIAHPKTSAAPKKKANFFRKLPRFF